MGAHEYTLVTREARNMRDGQGNYVQQHLWFLRIGALDVATLSCSRHACRPRRPHSVVLVWAVQYICVCIHICICVYVCVRAFF
jgi:hypothetical protein